MKKVIILSIFVACIGLIFACGGGTPPPENPTNKPTNTTETPKKAPATVDLGEKTYKQFCMVCHGKDGKMGASGAANLAESTLSMEEQIEIIKNGRNTMAGFGMIGEEKVNAVAKYIQKFSAN